MKTIILPITIVSLLLYLYGIYGILKELLFYDKSRYLTQDHKQVHFSILLYKLVGWTLLLALIFCAKGFSFGFNIILIKYHGWLFLLIASQMTTSTTRHFRKERHGEDLIVNYKDEIKSAMTFGYKKEKQQEL